MLNGTALCSPTIDIWSFGCVLAELVLNQPLFFGKNTIDQLEKIFSIIGMPSYSEI
jgi:serine/threonine protein kinase